MSTPAHTQPKNPTTNRFECPYGACYRSFARRYNLVTHYNTHFGVRMWECGVCCRRFTRRYDLQRHVGLRHPDVNGGKRLIRHGHEHDGMIAESEVHTFHGDASYSDTHYETVVDRETNAYAKDGGEGGGSEASAVGVGGGREGTCIDAGRGRKRKRTEEVAVVTTTTTTTTTTLTIDACADPHVPDHVVIGIDPITTGVRADSPIGHAVVPMQTTAAPLLVQHPRKHTAAPPMTTATSLTTPLSGDPAQVDGKELKDIGPPKYGQLDARVDVSGRVYTGDECDGGRWDVIVRKEATNTTGDAGDGQTRTQTHTQLRIPAAVHLQMQTLAQGQIPTPPPSGVVPRRFLGRKRSEHGGCPSESVENGETMTREVRRDEMGVQKDMGHVDEGVGLVDGPPQGMQSALERPLDGMSQDEEERRAIAVAVLLQVGGRG